MLSRGSTSSKRVTTPRTTISNPEHALDYVEELLYTSNAPDTTSDLRRPRAASGSDLIADDQQTVTAQKHVYGQPCPEYNEDCHYHHQLTQHCHISWRHCASALNAVKQSYGTGGEWIGAPEGWNETHDSCLKTDKKCDTHAKLQGVPLEKQKNKRYPGKPRVRGKDSRGTKNHQKGKNGA
ncbi:hypothetical protein KCU61_g8924, partial [Aureobasidium melanogenum]